MRGWRRFLVFILPIVLVVSGLGGYLFLPGGGPGGRGDVPIALALVETTTLSVLSGQVQVKPANTPGWLPALNGQTLTAGDSVKTLADSFALITYFEGSTTSIDKDTEYQITKLDKDAAGIKTEIGGKLVVGNTFSKVVRLLDPASRFEVETPSAVAVVRGTEFGVAVDTSGQTQMTAVTGEVVAEAGGVAVPVVAGQATTVQPGRPPDPPRPAPPPTHGLRLTMASPASLYVCDNAGRCTGLMPVAGVPQGVPVNQIPGAYYSGPDTEPQILAFPEPLKNYTLVLGALGDGGTYHFESAGIGNGEVHSSQGYAGTINKGTKQQSGFTVNITSDGRVEVGPISEPQETSGEAPGVKIIGRNLSSRYRPARQARRCSP